MTDYLIDLKKTAKAQGWLVEKTSKNQNKFTPPDKTKEIVIASGTPSDRNALKIITKMLVRSGLLLNAV